MFLRQKIEEKLTKEFCPLFLSVKDDSTHHVGHSGYRAGGESHFTVTLVSAEFSGLTRIQRHQRVYQCLQDELKGGVHALCLKLLSPEEPAALSE